MLKKKNRPKIRLKNSEKGYALLTAILAVSIFTVMLMKARTLWETELIRDLEQELIFRARQYVTAIELFRKKNTNMFPQSLDELFEKKFLRKRFTDPMTIEGKWNVVMRPGTPGKKTALLIVPEDMVPEYITQASIIGVCSSSCEEGFLVYRKKKKYCEWAIYLGEQVDKEMPELNFVGEGGGEAGEREERGEEDERGEREREIERKREEGPRSRDDGRERPRPREREVE
ncbi:MAG: hypothetical protein JSV88_18550 [Candidatus Aminicenantes bacterium]|nr:MAG: hypothetical protein JSV88_18550 [Candidatus Aminicenantes bacterium]